MSSDMILKFSLNQILKNDFMTMPDRGGVSVILYQFLRFEYASFSVMLFVKRKRATEFLPAGSSDKKYEAIHFIHDPP